MRTGRACHLKRTTVTDTVHTYATVCVPQRISIVNHRRGGSCWCTCPTSPRRNKAGSLTAAPFHRKVPLPPSQSLPSVAPPTCSAVPSLTKVKGGLAARAMWPCRSADNTTAHRLFPTGGASTTPSPTKPPPQKESSTCQWQSTAFPPATYGITRAAALGPIPTANRHAVPSPLSLPPPFPRAPPRAP